MRPAALDKGNAGMFAKQGNLVPPPGETNGSFTAAEALAGSGMARSCCRRAEAKVDQRQHPGA